MKRVEIKETAERTFLTQFVRTYRTLVEVHVPKDRKVTEVDGVPMVERVISHGSMEGMRELLTLQQACDEGLASYSDVK